MSFEYLESLGFGGFLVGLETERRVKKQTVIDKLLGFGANLRLRFEQVVEDRDPAILQDPVGFLERRFPIRDVVDNRLAPQMSESSVAKG